MLQKMTVFPASYLSLIQRRTARKYRAVCFLDGINQITSTNNLVSHPSVRSQRALLLTSTDLLLRSSFLLNSERSLEFLFHRFLLKPATVFYHKLLSYRYQGLPYLPALLPASHNRQIEQHIPGMTFKIRIGNISKVPDNNIRICNRRLHIYFFIIPCNWMDCIGVGCFPSFILTTSSNSD